MAYQILSGEGVWVTSTPRPTLKALLDEHPLGVSFLTEYDGAVKWRKTPRDEALIAEISDTLAINEGRDSRNVANKVYDLLENRGVL